MKANLLVFSDEGNTEFLEQLITFNIRPNFCLAMQEINTITFLSLNSSIAVPLLLSGIVRKLVIETLKSQLITSITLIL